jgi:hypothetical protein
MKLTTTLNEILKHRPCNQHPSAPRSSGWNRLIDHLGSDYDRDAEINLLTILESNGYEDCIWALRATKQDSKPVSVALAVAFAKRVLPIFEGKYPDDDQPRKATEAAETWLNDPTEENRRLAAYAADAAAYAAHAAADADDAAADAAAAAAYAADAAAYAAHAADAAYAADAAASRSDIQIPFNSIVREHFEQNYSKKLP